MNQFILNQNISFNETPVYFTVCIIDINAIKRTGNK